MRRVVTAALITTAMSGSHIVLAAPSEATSPLQLGTWIADPSGSDKPNNAGYNRETIQIRNVTSKAIAVAGYRVRDKQNHTFVFPKGYVLKAKATVTLHSGSGTNSATHVYWRQRGYVWNNTGDTAYLQTPKGAGLDSCTYRKSTSGRVNC